VSVLCNGLRYHLDAAALRDVSPSVAVIGSSAVAFIVLSLAGVVARWRGAQGSSLRSITPQLPLRMLRENPVLLLAASAGGAMGSWLLVYSVRQNGPAVSAFLFNLTIVMLVIGGLLTGERLRRGEIGAIVAIIGGALAFSYRGGRLDWMPVLIVGLAAALTAGKQLSAKFLAHREGVLATTAILAAMMSLITLAVSSIGGDLRVDHWHGLIFVVAAGLLGNVAGIVCLYKAYQLIGVARGGPIDALRPVVVLLIGVLGLGAPLPGIVQILGGAVIVAGSVALVVLRRQRKPISATDERDAVVATTG
jgi:drug/metabolite transporter (DMT)-like permease